jgi:hypothetical protein
VIEKVVGPGRSPLRLVSIALAIVIAVLGVMLMVDGQWPIGLSVTLLGLISGYVLARMADTREQKAEAREQLGRITGDVDEEVLARIVDEARHGGPGRLPSAERPQADDPDR